MNSLVRALMRRENIEKEEAIEMIRATFCMMDDGADPEDILLDEFGLEPDYIDDYLAMYEKETE